MDAHQICCSRLFVRLVWHVVCSSSKKKKRVRFYVFSIWRQTDFTVFDVETNRFDGFESRDRQFLRSFQNIHHIFTLFWFETDRFDVFDSDGFSVFGLGDRQFLRFVIIIQTVFAFLI